MTLKLFIPHPLWILSDDLPWRHNVSLAAGHGKLCASV